MQPGPTRRQLLKRGIFGGILLALGGGTLVALRRPRLRRVSAPLHVLDASEYSIFAAVAERVVGAEAGSAGADVAARADAVLALAEPGAVKDFRRLLRLFDNGLSGILTGTGLSPFTASSPSAQDGRLAAWERSRIALFRTGYQAMKRLAAACYYADPGTWEAIGYPGPPAILS